MRGARTLFIAGTCVLLAAAFSPVTADEVDVTLANVGTPGETGSGTAEVNLARSRVNVRASGLRAVSHENAVGQIIRGYSAWLVNSEDALSKLSLGFFTPDADGTARIEFRPRNERATLEGLGYNMVVIADEVEQATGQSQPSGPPVAAGNIPGTPAPVTPLPAFEVLMGKLDDVFRFQPEQITILSGQTVRWTNVSPSFIVPHTATRTEAIDGSEFGPGGEFDSGSVPSNGSFTRTFTLPPEVPFALWNYHCNTHAVIFPLGMVGRILVIALPQ